MDPGVGRHLHLAGGHGDAHLREGVGLDGHRDGRPGDGHLLAVGELEPVGARLLDQERAGQLAPVLHEELHRAAGVRALPLDGDPRPLHRAIGAGGEAHLGPARRLDRPVAPGDLPLGAAGVGRVEVGDLDVAGDGLGPGRPGGLGDAGDQPGPPAPQVRAQQERRDSPGGERADEGQPGPAGRPVGNRPGEVDRPRPLPGAGDVLVGQGRREAAGVERRRGPARARRRRAAPSAATRPRRRPWPPPRARPMPCARATTPPSRRPRARRSLRRPARRGGATWPSHPARLPAPRPRRASRWPRQRPPSRGR